MPRCFHGMMFLLTFCAAALGQESTPTLDRLPTSSDPLKPLAGPVELHSSTTAGHLLDAADSLRRAGRNEAADAIQKEAELLLKPGIETLQAKRQQRDLLDQEIQALEKSLQCPQSVSIRVQVYSVPADQAQTLLPRQLGIPLKLHDVAQIESLPRKRIVAETNLVTKTGQKSSVVQGGEVPIQLASVKGFHVHELGTRVDATPVCLGANRVRVDLRIEQNTLEVDEKDKSPITQSQAMNTQLELKFGEAFLLQNLESQGQITFLLVRVDPVASSKL